MISSSDDARSDSDEKNEYLRDGVVRYPLPPSSYTPNSSSDSEDDNDHDQLQAHQQRISSSTPRALDSDEKEDAPPCEDSLDVTLESSYHYDDEDVYTRLCREVDDLAYQLQGFVYSRHRSVKRALRRHLNKLQDQLERNDSFKGRDASSDYSTLEEYFM